MMATVRFVLVAGLLAFCSGEAWAEELQRVPGAGAESTVKIRKTKSRFDLDGNGRISMIEIRKVRAAEDAEYAEWIRMVDVNCDWEITPDEVASYIRKMDEEKMRKKTEIYWPHLETALLVVWRERASFTSLAERPWVSGGRSRAEQNLAAGVQAGF